MLPKLKDKTIIFHFMIRSIQNDKYFQMPNKTKPNQTKKNDFNWMKKKKKNKQNVYYLCESFGRRQIFVAQIRIGIVIILMEQDGKRARTKPNGGETTTKRWMQTTAAWRLWFYVAVLNVFGCIKKKKRKKKSRAISSENNVFLFPLITKI